MGPCGATGQSPPSRSVGCFPRFREDSERSEGLFSAGPAPPPSTASHPLQSPSRLCLGHTSLGTRRRCWAGCTLQRADWITQRVLLLLHCSNIQKIMKIELQIQQIFKTHIEQILMFCHICLMSSFFLIKPFSFEITEDSHHVVTDNIERDLVYPYRFPPQQHLSKSQYNGTSRELTLIQAEYRFFPSPPAPLLVPFTSNPPAPDPWQPIICPTAVILSYQGGYRNGIIQCIAFWNCLSLLSIIPLRLIQKYKK